MKAYFFATTLLCLSAISQVFAQHYRPVEQGSLVQFSVEHQMIFKSTVTGTFSGLKGSIVFDPHETGKDFFDVSVEAGTISSGIGMRNADLKKEKYFNQQQYSLITIKSKNISRGSGDGMYQFSGTLTMKGVTKPISFPFSAVPADGGYKFKGHFQLNRLDYNVGPDNSIDKNVEIDLSVLAK